MEYAALSISFVLLVLCLNWSYFFTVKNLFLVYAFFIYNISPLIFTEFDASYYEWFFEYVIVMLMFVSGYYLGINLNRESKNTKVVLFSEDYFKKINRLKIFFWIVFTANLLYSFKSIATFGLSGFYSGAQLVNTISNYGLADAEGARDQIINFTLGSFMLAGLAVILERAMVRLNQNQLSGKSHLLNVNQEMKNIIVRMPIALFLLLPLLQFFRGAFVFGTLTLFAIFFWSGVGFSIKKILIIAIIALSVFIIIGQSREKLLGAEANAVNQLASELTPWIAYREIKENIDYLDYQYGKTIIMPLITHIIPRALWTEKPHNTTGYFNTAIHPEASSAGYMLAPTLVGVLYLNFGLVGVFIGVCLLGIFSGLIDAIAIYKNFKKFGLFIIVFSSYLSLLRNDPSVVLFNIGTVIILYQIFRKKFRVI